MPITYHDKRNLELVKEYVAEICEIMHKDYETHDPDLSWAITIQESWPPEEDRASSYDNVLGAMECSRELPEGEEIECLLWLNPLFFTSTKHQQRQTILHEILHALHRPIDYIVFDLCQGEVQSEHFTAYRRHYEDFLLFVGKMMTDSIPLPPTFE